MHELIEQNLLPFLSAVAISLPRILVCLLLVPVLSTKLIKGLVRNAAVIAIALPVAYGISSNSQQEPMPLLLIGLYSLKEAAIGLILGFVLGIPFWLFDAVGTIFDNQRGAASAQQMNPATGVNALLMGGVLQQALIVLMIEIGAFVWFFQVIVNSYAVWPANAWMPPIGENGALLLIGEFTQLTKDFMLYATPLLALLLVIEFCLALLGLFSPQLQVFFLAMPAKSLVGILFLALYLNTLWQLGSTQFSQYLDKSVLLEKIFVQDRAGHEREN